MKPADVVRLPPVFVRGFDQHPEDARVLPARPARFQQVNGAQHVVAGVVLRIINGQRTSICASVRGHANMSFHEEPGKNLPTRLAPAATRSPARPRLPTLARLCLNDPSSIKTS